MHIHQFRSEIWLARPIKEVFAFFSNAANLDSITPPWLSFRTVARQPIEMHAGTVIDYRLRVRGFPVQWRSEITEWEPPYHFVDEQIRGPYRLWIHAHRFQTRNGARLCATMCAMLFRSIGSSTNSLCVQTWNASSPTERTVCEGNSAMSERVSRRVYCARNAVIGSTFVARSAGT
jgi:ligand-binding SRPBCC domain-containing protein